MQDKNKQDVTAEQPVTCRLRLYEVHSLQMIPTKREEISQLCSSYKNNNYVQDPSHHFFTVQRCLQ